MSTPPASVAYEALNLAKDAHQKIDSHEDICAIRYGHLGESIARLEGFIKWGGSAAFMIIIALLGFFAKAQFDANASLTQGIEARMRVMEMQRQ